MWTELLPINQIVKLIPTLDIVFNDGNRCTHLGKLLEMVSAVELSRSFSLVDTFTLGAFLKSQKIKFHLLQNVNTYPSN